MKRVVVCMGCCCPQLGGTELLAQLQEKLKERKDVLLQDSECIGPCSQGPNVVVNNKILYRAHTQEVMNELNSAPTQEEEE